MRARVLLAGLHLLDRQLIDRDGRLAGKVDDVELTLDDRTGDLRVTALLSGHGSLLRRLGSHRLADWMEDRQHAEHGEHSRIPIDRVTDIGSAIHIGLAHEELATFDTERWIRDHVTSHIAGSRHEDANVKLSELLHRRVCDEQGADLGLIADVRLVQDGRPVVGPDRSLRVDGLVIGRRSWAVRLGLTRPDHTGPAILKHPARWLAGTHDYVPWTQVTSIDGDAVHIVGEPRELPAPDG